MLIGILFMFLFYYFLLIAAIGSICACAALRWPCVRLWAAWA
jgi:hypothetical protein